VLETDGVFLAKAEESLAGAQSEFGNGRYNNCANRCYYACFQAAIQALSRAGIRPRGSPDQWSHEFVQAEFIGQLINRRKLYPAGLRDTLIRGLALRRTADYSRLLADQTRASRALRRSVEFVEAVRSRSR
jgi:uncharacterized protein (UPF0332 family)